MKLKATKIPDPAAYFRDWDYLIAPCHYEALGVTLRPYIDRDKTTDVQAKALASGMPAKQASQIKIHYLCHATNSPPCFDFHVGDIFYQQKGEARHFIQVAASPEPTTLEVHFGIVGHDGACNGYVISANDLAAWLKAGTTNRDLNSVTRESSQAGLMAWFLSSPN